MTPELRKAAHDAETGDDTAMRKLATDDADARVLLAAFFYLVSGDPPPTLEQIADCKDQELAAYALCLLARASCVARTPTCRRLLEFATQHSEQSESFPRSHLALCWSQLASGRVPCEPNEVLSYRVEDDPTLYAEFLSARAWCAAAVESDQALASARTAVRVAHTEGLPQIQYMSGLALARARRVGGRPYLAGRILSALKPRTSTLYDERIAWELLMAGYELTAAPGIAQHLQTLLTSGSAAQKQGGLARCEEDNTDPLMGADIASLRRLLGVSTLQDQRVESEERFMQGLSHEVPAWLQGVAAAPSTWSELDATCVAAQSVAAVLARPLSESVHAVRTLIPLSASGDGQVLKSHPSNGRRALSGIAALCLSGGQATEQELWKSTYQLEYQPEKHRDILKVLIRRMRSNLGSHGRIERLGTSVRIHLSDSILVVDPRCQSSPERRVLEEIAACAGSCRDIAERIGMPVRSVQRILRQLVESGDCARRRGGRDVVYSLEDTTFHEPSSRNMRVP